MPTWKSFVYVTSLLAMSIGIHQATLDAQERSPVAEAEKEIPKLSPEAQVAARRGVEFLQEKDYKKAIEIFKVAVRMHPDQAQLQHFLGYAYAQDQQLGLAWLHFRQAVRLNPRYGNAVRDFSSLWQVFFARGVFDCGRSGEELVKLIGKPDKVTKPGSIEVWEYGFKQLHLQDGRVMAVVDPRGLTAAVAGAKYKLEIEFDDQSRWRLGYRTVSRIQSLSEYIPAGQSIREWEEMYTVQRLHGLAKKQTTGDLMRQLETSLKKRNPNVEFAVLAESENDVLFHWRDVGDKQRKPQHEIVRLVAGERDIHRLAYSQRVDQIPSETAQAWAGILRQAKLVPAPTPSTATP